MMYLFKDESIANRLRDAGFNVIRNNGNPNLPFGVIQNDEIEKWLLKNFDKKLFVKTEFMCF